MRVSIHRHKSLSEDLARGLGTGKSVSRLSWSIRWIIIVEGRLYVAMSFQNAHDFRAIRGIAADQGGAVARQRLE